LSDIVEDDVAARAGAHERIEIADVALNLLHAVRKLGRQVQIERAHGVPRRTQLLNEQTAEVPSAAGYERVHSVHVQI